MTALRARLDESGLAVPNQLPAAVGSGPVFFGDIGGLRRRQYTMVGDAGHVTDEIELGELESLRAVRMFPIRIKCALLGWSALEQGIEEYRGRTAG
ncbi:MAG: hypothetical protein IH796_00360 [Deltaproteobacteria bacterium]|nr:hypothetical protein [Deltaproteobacteria bacterium]